MTTYKIEKVSPIKLHITNNSIYMHEKLNTFAEVL